MSLSSLAENLRKITESGANLAVTVAQAQHLNKMIGVDMFPTTVGETRLFQSRLSGTVFPVTCLAGDELRKSIVLCGLAGTDEAVPVEGSVIVPCTRCMRDVMFCPEGTPQGAEPWCSGCFMHAKREQDEARNE